MCRRKQSYIPLDYIKLTSDVGLTLLISRSLEYVRKSTMRFSLKNGVLCGGARG